MEEHIVSNVRKSYGRVAMTPQFFSDFYENLLASSPEIPPMFKHTDMKKQESFVRDGIAFLVMYARDPELGEFQIKKLGERHSRNQINVRPDLYRLWIASLVKTLKKHDPYFDAELEKDWRHVVQEGIDLMKSAY